MRGEPLCVLVVVVAVVPGRAAAARPPGEARGGMGRANGSGLAGRRRGAPPLRK